MALPRADLRRGARLQQLALLAVCLAAAPLGAAAAFKCCTADNMAAPSCAAVTTPNDPVVCSALGDLWAAFGGAVGLSRNLGGAVGAAFGCNSAQGCTNPAPPPNVWSSAATTNWGLSASGVPQDYCSFDGSPPGPPTNAAWIGYIPSVIPCPTGYQAVLASGDPTVQLTPPVVLQPGNYGTLTTCGSNTLALNTPATCTITLQPKQRVVVTICAQPVGSTGCPNTDIQSLPMGVAYGTPVNNVWPLTITDASNDPLPLLGPDDIGGNYFHFMHPSVRGYNNSGATPMTVTISLGCTSGFCSSDSPIMMFGTSQMHMYLSPVADPPAQFTCVYNAGRSMGIARLPEQLGESYMWRACDATTRQLTSLSFFAYGFAGTLPASLGNITSLTALNFAANALTGTLPPTLGKLTNLRRLSVQNGRANSQVGFPYAMDYLGQNQLTGTIPETLGALTALTSLSMAMNQLSGSIPASFGSLTALTLLDLGGNILSGTIPSTLGNLFPTAGPNTVLQLSTNEFSGPITFLGSISASVIDLSNNNLTGAVPAMALDKAVVIMLQNNSLTSLPGAMPITGACTINLFDVSWNKLSGPLPAYFSGCASTLATAVTVKVRGGTPVNGLRLQGNYLAGDVSVFNASTVDASCCLPSVADPTVCAASATYISLVSVALICTAQPRIWPFLPSFLTVVPQLGFNLTPQMTAVVATAAQLAAALAPVLACWDRSTQYTVENCYLTSGTASNAFMLRTTMQVTVTAHLQMSPFILGGLAGSTSNSYTGQSLVLIGDASACGGPCRLTLPAGTTDRHFKLAVGSALKLVNIALIGGVSPTDPAGAYLNGDYSYFGVVGVIPTGYWGGGAVFLDQQSALLMLNSTLQNNTGYPNGGAIYSDNTHPGAVVLQNVVATNNVQALPPGMPSDYVYQQPPSGGVVHAANNVVMQGCSMTGNSAAGSGGAVSAGLSVQISSSTLASNSAGINGGAVYVSRLGRYQGLDLFGVPHSSVQPAGVGPFFSQANTVQFSTFSSNTAGSSGFGGALYLPAGSVMQLSAITANGNQAGLGGGAVFGDGLTITGSAFDSNRVSDPAALVPDACSPFGGGAVSAAGSGGLTVTSSTFTNNFGATQGGALLAAFSPPAAGGAWAAATLTNVVMRGNSVATGGGGGAVLNGVAATISNLTCVNNVAGSLSNGGCLNVLQPGGGFTLGGGSQLNGNSAGQGGALSITCGVECAGTQSCTAVPAYAVTGATFSGNTATEQGGGVFVYGGGLSITGSAVTSNVAAGVSAQGGGILVREYGTNALSSPALSIAATAVTNNSVQLLPVESTGLLMGTSYNAFSGAGNGGGIFIATAQAVANVLLLAGTSVSSNAAVNGAGAFVYGNAALTVTSATLSSNVATGTGGAMVIQSAPLAVSGRRRGLLTASPGVSATLTGATFTGNAALTGGAVTLNSGSSLAASGSNFSANTAVNGAVFALSVLGAPAGAPTPRLSLSSTSAGGNSASVSGGLFYTDAPTGVALNPPPSVSADSTLGNSAPSGADGLVTEAQGFALSAAALSTKSGALLPPFTVTLLDSLGQVLNESTGLVFVVTANGTGLGGQTTVNYGAGKAVFSLLKLTDDIGTVYQLTVTLKSSLLTALDGTTRTVLATVEPCPGAEVFEATSKTCQCGDNSIFTASGGCACKPGYYDIYFGVGPDSPKCAVCPLGGSCTTGTVGAADGYWRETTRSADFYRCREGLCVEEIVEGPLGSNAPAADAPAPARRRQRRQLLQLPLNATVPQNCVEGNGGPLCALCLPGYAMQSGVCAPCDPADAFDNWSQGSKGGLLIGCIIAGMIILAFGLFQPIVPFLERTALAATDAAGTATERMKACITCACCRSKQRDPIPASRMSDAAGATNGTNGKAENGAKGTNDKPETVKQGVVAEAREEAVDHIVSSNAAFAFGSLASAFASDDAEGDDGEGSNSGGGSFDEGIAEHLDFMDELEELLEKLQRISKIIVNFYQIVSNFLKSLSIPWPSAFGVIMARVNIINLNLVQLPKTACMNPSPSYYSQFNGYTLGLLTACFGMWFLWLFGSRLVSRFTLRDMPEQEREERLSRFNSTVLARTLLMLYLVYPGVSVAIFGMFTCTSLKSGVAYLDADFNITCYDRVHWRYVGGAIVWLALVPVGVPYFFIWLLRHFKVPQMAKLLYDNAWLRMAVKEAWQAGVAQPSLDVAKLSVETIEQAHLEGLYAFHVGKKSAEEASAIISGTAPPYVAEEAKPEVPKRLVKRLFFAAQAAVAAAAAAVAGRCSAPPAYESEEAARRALVLAELIVTCRIGGVMSLPVIQWEEMEDEPAEEADGKAVHDESAVVTRNLPQLQRRAMKEVGFLFAAYHADCWYWETVELGRKLILTSILALIAPGSAGQVVVGLLMAFFALLINTRLKPYADNNLNFINQIAQLNLFFFLLVALLLKVNLDGEGDSGFYSGIVGTLSIVPIGLPIFIKLYVRFFGGLEARMMLKDAEFE